MNSTPRSGRLGKLLWVAALALGGGLCLVILAGLAFFVIRTRGAAPEPLTPAPVTLIPTALPTLATPTAHPSTTRQPSPTLTQTAVQRETPSRTPTARPATPTRGTATPTPFSPAATPTPIVCTDPSALSSMVLAPGQSFSCTVSEAYLNDQLDNVPENPCQEASILLEEGQFTLICRMGIRLTATGVAQVSNCGLRLQITKGTPGFTNLVQDMINTQMALLPADAVCVESVDIQDGQMSVTGYAR